MKAVGTQSLGWEKAQEEVERLINKIPLLRAGTPEKVADVVLFLCSEDSNYIIGRTIYVDRGGEMN